MGPTKGSFGWKGVMPVGFRGDGAPHGSITVYSSIEVISVCCEGFPLGRRGGEGGGCTR